MNSSPLVSILLTAFNREKYIAFAIESVLASSYANFEWIIVGDLKLWYNKAANSPLLTGSGTRLKILEAMGLVCR